MSAGGNYDPSKTSLILGGTEIEGFSSDSIIEVSYDAPRRFTKKGARGEVTSTTNPDRSGTLKIMLNSSSASNEYLSALANSDTNFSWLARDGSGTTTAASAHSYIINIPPISFKKEEHDVTWEIFVEDLEMFNGKNIVE